MMAKSPFQIILRNINNTIRRPNIAISVEAVKIRAPSENPNIAVYLAREYLKVKIGNIKSPPKSEATTA